ncbi:hypothetical protein EGR_05270 [Echinococcus granulosus]|uniref:Uncharacterized protein n=1 Tax=Echinococcus granulosus TaxID=6210 RepID=W6V248_ECHGR|nr:hypothetical protein EGR_05270 [Echinococcus granulosus]EUB59944.1 hypothetical protein EGR_05270 [Echinococcus granulosus]
MEDTRGYVVFTYPDESPDSISTASKWDYYCFVYQCSSLFEFCTKQFINLFQTMLGYFWKTDKGYLLNHDVYELCSLVKLRTNFDDNWFVVLFSVECGRFSARTTHNVPKITCGIACELGKGVQNNASLFNIFCKVDLSDEPQHCVNYVLEDDLLLIVDFNIIECHLSLLLKCLRLWLILKKENRASTLFDLKLEKKMFCYFREENLFKRMLSLFPECTQDVAMAAIATLSIVGQLG